MLACLQHTIRVGRRGVEVIYPIKQGCHSWLPTPERRTNLLTVGVKIEMMKVSEGKENEAPKILRSTSENESNTLSSRWG